MSMTKPHEEWISRAQGDVDFAGVGLREGFYSQTCFLAQQAVEKSLKGVCVFLKRPYPKIHSLVELAKTLPELPLNAWREKLAILDGCYVPMRYPDAVPGSTSSCMPNKEEAAAALFTAQEILQMVLQFTRK